MSTTVDYTLKPDRVSVITYDKEGIPEAFALDSTHPTFNALVRALKRKDWKRVPKLVSMAAAVADQTEGNIKIKADGIYYKGGKINNSLTRRIDEIIRRGQPVKAMLRFMDKMYQNPEAFAINELYDWLDGCKLPITDDGCFMAYKRVRDDYKDCYTGTIDNTPGQDVFMKRVDVCKDRHRTCDQGLHFCSIAYLPNYPGDKIMKVKINPKDVVSIPTDYQFSKGRTWRYEVIGEVPKEDLQKLIAMKEDIDEFQTGVYSIARERRKLLADTLAMPSVKRLIKRRKIGELNIRKMSYGRLVTFYKKFYVHEPSVMSAVDDTNKLKAIREAYGFTRGQVAEASGMTYGQVYRAEVADKPQQDVMDMFLGTIMVLAKLGSNGTASTAVAYPKRTSAQKPLASPNVIYPDPYDDLDSELDDLDEYGYGEGDPWDWDDRD